MKKPEEVKHSIEFLMKFREIGCSLIVECQGIVEELDKITNMNPESRKISEKISYIKLIYYHKIMSLKSFLSTNRVIIDMNSILLLIDNLEKNITPKKIKVVKNKFSIELNQIFEKFKSHCYSIEPIYLNV